MGNPIQYCNTDNPSQIQGWVSHNKGGFHKKAFIIMVCPPGRTQGGLMKTFHRMLHDLLIKVELEDTIMNFPMLIHKII